MKPTDYKFIMLSAMYENGGNTTHRLLDGHPELFVYPFESQPGSKFVNDYLSSMYPLKYRWPIFPGSATVEEIYELIIDEEGKVRAKTPYVSKFRTADFQMSDKDRKADFVAFLQGKELSRANIMEAFFRSSFTAWKNYKTTGQEKGWVGYSPIIGVDGDKIINDDNWSLLRESCCTAGKSSNAAAAMATTPPKATGVHSRICSRVTRAGVPP